MPPTTVVSPITHEDAQRPTAAALQAAARLEHVSKRLRGRQVLDNVSFAVHEGEAVALTGAHGAGKTSALRCLLDFTRPDSGHAWLFGVDSRDPMSRSEVQFLPEGFAPPPHLSGHDVLHWLAGLHGRDWSRDQTRVAFERFGLPAEAAGRAVRHYSPSMTRQLGLAATLMSSARLLVLDEPMAGLDADARRLVARSLETLRDDGRAVLVTAIDAADVSAFCDRVLMLRDGRLADIPAR